jgi:hypothetical protein
MKISDYKAIAFGNIIISVNAVYKTENKVFRNNTNFKYYQK